MEKDDAKLNEKRKKHAEYMRKYYADDPNKRAVRAAAVKVYREKNPDQMKNWRNNNKEHIAAYSKQQRLQYKETLGGRFMIMRAQCQTQDSVANRPTDNIISVEEMARIYEEQGGKCAYTGVKLSFEPGPFFMSVDRVDSTKSHIPGNCKFVTLPVNRLKSNMTMDQYNELLNNIRWNVGEEYQAPPYDTFSTKTKEKIYMLMTDLRRRALKAKLPCEINLQTFKKWRLEQNDMCRLTSVHVTWEPKQWNTGSIDRIDSNKGYTLDNIQIVLWPINMMKNDMTDDEAKVVIDYLL
jgi:hypothetical protein